VVSKIRPTKTDMKKLTFSETVIRQIRETIGKAAPECGGVLGSRDGEIISEYFFDATGRSSQNGYAPDTQAINHTLANEWMPQGIVMVGIVHSHANCVDVPSCGDINYGIRILLSLDTVSEFYLPIVTIDEDIHMSCYVIAPDPERQFICQKVEYDIIPG